MSFLLSFLRSLNVIKSVAMEKSLAIFLSHACWVAVGYTTINLHVKKHGKHGQRSTLPLDESAAANSKGNTGTTYLWIMGGYAASVAVFSLVRGLMDLVVLCVAGSIETGLGLPPGPMDEVRVRRVAKTTSCLKFVDVFELG